MTDFSEILGAVKGIDDTFTAFRDSQAETVAALRERIEELESRRNLPGRTVPGAASAGLTFKTAAGIEYPVLRHGEKFADRYDSKGDSFNLAEFVDASINGRETKTVSSGTATVDSVLSAQIIDAVRARTVVIEAGAPTIMVADGGSILGRITGDPTVIQHTEGANDVTTSDVTVDAVTLKPKALVARIPLSAEVVADSPNLDLLLTTSLAAAFAAKLDALCIATLLADANIPESAAGQDPAVWAKVLEAVGSAMALNQGIPAALIGNTADYIARASQLASTAGTWLGAPPALAGMRDLPTTSITAGFALMGSFADAMVIAMRQSLKFEIVRFADAARYSHELVAHARMDGVVTQPARLYRMLKTV